MAYTSYNFGVEIETVVRPYSRRPNFSAQDWYKQLAQSLENRNIPAAPDLYQRYSTHPEYYSSKWFITRDGSLQRAHETFVSMEIVSPVLNTGKPITKILSEFWEAMSVGFEVQKERTCGGHVHVTPSSSTSKFTLLELKKIAFASIVYESFVHTILPVSRRNNRYCVMNSAAGTHGLGVACTRGLSTSELRSIKSSLQQVSSLAGLLAYMQPSRYVIWNFANICPRQAGGSCSGTLEFRGGSQFLNMKTTLKWLAFTVAFINMALDEGNPWDIDSFSYVPASDPDFDAHVKTWWRSVRKAAAKLKVMRHLPDYWKQMRLG